MTIATLLLLFKSTLADLWKNVYDMFAFSLSESLRSRTAKKNRGAVNDIYYYSAFFNERCHSIATLLLRKLTSPFLIYSPLKIHPRFFLRPLDIFMIPVISSSSYTSYLRLKNFFIYGPPIFYGPCGL